LKFTFIITTTYFIIVIIYPDQKGCPHTEDVGAG
ncbi:hypothetical protein CCACVL1_12662, partial [Corchorus capsularis]